MNQTSDQLQQYKQCINEHLLCTEPVKVPELLKLKNVFDFIQNNLPRIGENVLLADVLPILLHSIRLEMFNNNDKIEIQHHILLLFNKATTEELHELCFENSLQILYQILYTLTPEKRVDLEDEVFLLLIRKLPKIKDKRLKANLLACVQFYARKFEAPNVLLHLWHGIENNLKADNDETLQILITLFDDFAGCAKIENFQILLQTTDLLMELISHDEHDKRKCAYFLLKKSHSFFTEDTQFWTTCINIFENLEENQSHLILPSLQLLRTLKAKNSQESKWLNVLHNKILLHNNILVRRWVLEYFLEQLTFSELPLENAYHFLQALNETALYNIEGYMLPTENIPRFLTCNSANFLKTFCQINWKAVPLHYWFTQLLQIWKTFDSLHATDEKLLLHLATKIRSLQNVQIRQQVIKHFYQLFSKLIASMDLLGYVELVKTLHNLSDPYDDFDLFGQKFESFNLEKCPNHLFDQRFYEIITNQIVLPGGCSLKNSYENLLLQKLEGVDILRLNCLSLLIVFEFQESSEKLGFCQRKMNLDLFNLTQMRNFEVLYNILNEKIGSCIENKTFLRRKAMDFYICHSKCINDFNDALNLDIKLDEILSTGSSATLLRLTKLLADHGEFVGGNVLDELLNSLRDYLRIEPICLAFCSNLLEYFKKVLQPSECAFWVKKLLEVDLENSAIAVAVLINGNVQLNHETFLLQGVLNCDTKTGDSRIEEVYLSKCTAKVTKAFHIRHAYVYQITKVESNKLQQSILLKVCDMAKKLNLKKTRYFAHSQEHRMLIRMALLLWHLKNTKTDVQARSELFQQLWSLLMDHNNQPNVAIIYECLIAHYADLATLMDAIKTLKLQTKCTSSQEVAMTMLLYRYFDMKFDCHSPKDYAEVITFLWPLTMGSSFQTRLYAQLVVFALIEKLEIKLKTEKDVTIEQQSFLQLKTAIETMIGKAQLKEFLQDFRFTPTNDNNFFNEIMFLTQTPYDEYEKTPQHFQNDSKLATKKLLDLAKGDLSVAKPQNQSSITIAADVQRKLNPFTDFMPQPNLISYPAYKESELFVIASFIDKIPNLGGIARTCEVLGVRNLVMASKLDTAKDDFKNLSMTAEKTLNIIEVKPVDLQRFIMEKKLEGFSIVGAEQTAKSVSFANFKFPKRTLLILGHEKEGIPPGFLNFLDYAVEIPQFGMVRSLNVHVTGALFMWEYCKQHICTMK